MARRRDSCREHEEYSRGGEEGKLEPPHGKHCPVSHPPVTESGHV